MSKESGLKICWSTLKELKGYSLFLFPIDDYQYFNSSSTAVFFRNIAELRRANKSWAIKAKRTGFRILQIWAHL